MFPALIRYPVQYQWPFKSYIWNLNQLLKPNMRRCYINYPSNNQYVTTPIFYVNAGPHIGHLYSAVLADSVTRFQSMLGYTTFMSTGTDEHGNKVERAARDANLPIDKYCTQISQKFRDMCDKFDVGYSGYIRTTETRHRDTVHQFWNTLKAGGHIYLGKYSGWYCESDEAFLTDLDLTEKKTASGEIIKVSNESGHPVEWTEENNYKFRLSNFQDDLKHWLKDEKAVQPSKYHKILLSWIEDGACLEDLSVSRPRRRVPWGIAVPQDDTHSIYVWLDALVNYLTVIGYPEERYKKFWPPSVQVIGKDILKFHGVYWPAFLIAAGLEPPKTLLCHSHWTVESEKMSKSKGNVVSPFEAAATFTEDGLRYFLLREAVPHSDANYSAVKVQRIVNSELADTLGNLISRCTGKTVNPTREIPNPAECSDVLKSDSAKSLLRNLETLKDTAEKSYKEYNLHHVVDAVMSTLHSANQMVDYHKPWQLRKETNNPESINQLKAVISLALEAARISGLILYPIVPKMSSNLLDYLSVPPENRTWEDARSKHLNDSPNESRQLGQGNTILFRRIRN
ncbi:methionine--tRNA ligase, mitochondrial isoform X2 [Cephus cinctus]|nr:methionine--tRNA ligase, mitochondrial isoform X2 [Cephus cinctus]